MNICMFSPFSFSMESSTHRLLCLAEELVKRGNQVSIVLPSFDRHSSFSHQKINRYHGMSVIQPYQPRINALELSTLPYIFSSLLKVLPTHLDVLHSLKPLPITSAPYLIKSLKRTPIVQDMDDLDHIVMIAEKQSLARIKVVKSCETILPNLADHITTVSSTLKKIYVDMGFDDGMITWIPNGVHTTDFCTTPDLELKKSLRLKSKVIVFLGSLNNQVQLYPLIKAMKLIVKGRLDVSCLIIGDGTAKLFFEQLTQEQGLANYIKFVGKLPYSQVARYLSICDVGFVCFPPRFPNTGGALKAFIYMASGLPVVVNDVGDLPYYVDFGKAGTVSNLDAQNLSEAFLTLLNNDELRRKKSRYAREYVKKNFDWEVLAKKLEHVYEKVAK